MKKLLVFLVMLLATAFLFADETVLVKSDAVADLDGYDYVKNFEITSSSGYFTSKTLKILTPNEKGFRFMAVGVPSDKSTHYEIYPSYPSFLNEANVGAGYIDNAASIKSIKLIATTNRPYDEIYILYSTSPLGEVKRVKMPQDFNKIKSMEEFELVYENPLYEPDVTKREVKAAPVLGGNSDNGIYFRGISIQTNMPSGYNTYSEISVFYLKEVSFIYDKAFTDKQIEAKKAMKEEFGIQENVEATDKAKAKVEERLRIQALEEELKHKESSNAK